MSGDLTLSEVLTRCSERGGAITAHQLERWRGKRLLPPARQVHGEGRRGSEAFYPASTVPQALAIARFLAEKRQLDSVGWHLWWEGHQVDACHWKPELDRAAALLRRGFRFLSRLMNCDGDSQPFMEKYGQPLLKKLPISASIRRMDNDSIFESIVALGNMILGHFRAFHSELDKEDGDARYNSMRNFFGFKRGDKRKNSASGINYREGMENGFKVIADSNLSTASFQDFTDWEIVSARDKIRDTFRTIAIFDNLSIHQLGQGAQGLKVVAWFNSNMSRPVQACITLLWAHVDRGEDSFLTSAEILGMRLLVGEV